MMQKPLQIGITGGIGAGKSMVCKIFQAMGVPAYDADSRAKAVMTTDGILISAIEKEFGKLSFNTDGTLNREYLSQEVFNDEAKLKKLNLMVHPRVALDYQSWVEAQSAPYVLKEAALLVESGTYKALDKLIVVQAPEALRIKRVLERDKQRTEKQVKEIISNQLAEDEKLKRADFVINNDETSLLTQQVLKLHQELVELAGSKA